MINQATAVMGAIFIAPFLQQLLLNDIFENQKN